MRRGMILVGIVVAIGAWWLWSTDSSWHEAVAQYIENGEFTTLEAHYSADNLMDKHRKELLADEQHQFLDPTLKFYPFLLLDVKYVQADKKTRQGVILWSLTDGEMVIDTGNWETTHGFEDAINSNASRTDFRLMYALAKHQGSLTLDQLQDELHIEAETLAPWIANACEKQLVVQTGRDVQLHVEDPKILVLPQTKIKQAFVMRSYNNANRVAKKYSKSQIEKIAKAAFGTGFTIRSMKEVFLPVHCLSVQNPDGTIFTTYWNALTGQPLTER